MQQMIIKIIQVMNCNNICMYVNVCGMVFISKLVILQIQKWERLVLQICDLFVPFNQLIFSLITLFSCSLKVDMSKLLL